LIVGVTVIDNGIDGKDILAEVVQLAKSQLLE
jgi:hypothetical protein